MPTGPCRRLVPIAAVAAVFSVAAGGARLGADEGMFTFDDPPTKPLEALGFRFPAGWLDSA